MTDLEYRQCQTRLPNKGDTTPPFLKKNGRTAPPSASPRGMRRQGSTSHSTSQAHHLARIICNSLWGQKLTFHPYVNGEALVVFSELWPDKRTLLDTFKDAEMNKRPYDLCKLILATNSYKTLDILLDEQAVNVQCDFGCGCGSLMHLTCALGQPEMIQSLLRKSQANTKIWSVRDGEAHIPEEVCMKADIRKLLPSHSLFTRKNLLQIQTPTSEHKKEMFELATHSDGFYYLINMLNTYSPFDVNNERNDDGDLLIHVAIKGGLPQLPLLFALVNFYQADMRQRDAEATTPLGLAIALGEDTLAEVLVCVFGVDINEVSSSDKLTPLHVAVKHSRPRIVNMLLRRGADALKEDSGGCVPAFLARKNHEMECRQIISQHLKERTAKICQDTISGHLCVEKLYPSDLCVVSNGYTLLMLAAMNNQETVLRALLKKGECPLDFRQMQSADLEDSLSSSMETSWCETDVSKEHTLKTAVHMAAEKGNLGCLQELLNANAIPSLEDCTGWFPLHYAVEKGYIECVKAILAYPNYQGLTGLKPALDISRGNGFTEITTVLEEASLRRQEELITPLLFEVARSGNKDHLFRLLQNGDNVNPLNEASDWPLLLAAGFGYDDMVAQLHQFGGHVAKRHRLSRSTPLHVAARGGHTKVVKYLLKFCRSFTDMSDKGVCPGGMPSGMMESEDAQFIDINGKNAACATPLELAASQGHTEVVRLLLDRGASTTLPDSNGRLLACTAFAGTQFLLETHRKERCRSIINSLRSNCQLKAFRQCWQGPSDFNLYASNGDNMLMLAAHHAPPPVLQFMLEQAAAVKPAMLISSEDIPLLLSSTTSTRSEESSDTSLPTRHSCNKSDSLITPSLTFVSKPYDPDRDEPERHTALPTVFLKHQPSREERLTSSGGSSPVFQAPKKPARSWIKPHPLNGMGHTTAVSSSEDEEPVNTRLVSIANAASAKDLPGSDNECMDVCDPFTNLIRFVNVRDGRTCLHRACEATNPQNVALLLKRDEELANIVDYAGDTGLHLACNQAHKQTVQTLLNFKFVMTTIRNKKNELPEQNCIKSAIKKLVCKVRRQQAGRELGFPDPPSRVVATGVSVSMERAEQTPGGMPLIPEAIDPYSSVQSDLSLKDLNQRLQQMKSEINSGPSTQQ